MKNEAWDTTRDLALLEEIERNPDTTQASLADRLGVAVGTVNWHLKRLIAKGYVKVKRAERKKLKYIITSEGLSLRAHLTVAYIENSMALFRKVRGESREALRQARTNRVERIVIDGDGDLAEVCRLTCIEQGFKVVEDGNGPSTGVLRIQGRKVTFMSPEESS
jgi:DNA-binding MarR family transcriptional regulator